MDNDIYIQMKDQEFYTKQAQKCIARAKERIKEGKYPCSTLLSESVKMARCYPIVERIVELLA